jgi:3-hydroxybutyryl-CoA dehydrogenase
MPLDARAAVGVVGAGAMGTGIAQVAAAAGHRVTVHDADADAMTRARASLEKVHARLVEKGKLDAAAAKETLARIEFAQTTDAFAPCALVIEAVVEDLDAKRALFVALEGVVEGDCVLATNTSSLSVSAIASACRTGERVLGVHFFNPAPLMRLVEVVPGIQTSDDVVALTRKLVDGWGKTTVRAQDTPGFIVNRVARPFYGEALRILDEGVADAGTIDWAMTELGGFRMGPFALMDLIGNDVNYAVTESVFRAFYNDPRYKPSFTQKRMVESGLLGRKSGRGFYDYTDGARNPEPRRHEPLGREILMRVLVMLINEAAEALFWGVASRDDIDLAMTKGVNYPKGLLRWADELGIPNVLARLEALHREYAEDRYRPSPLLRRMEREGTTFW